MKKHMIAILWLATLSAALRAQECAYEKYFYWAGSASIDYTERKFEAAEKKFRIAFSKAPFPQGKDLDLALKTAVQTKDTAWAKSISVRLASGGVPLAYFADFRNYAWYPDFQKDIPGYIESYTDSFDLEIRDKLLALGLQDSLFNEKYHLWRTGKIEMSLDKLIEGASEISNGFRKLIEDHGFPCEQKTGYYYHDGEIQLLPVVILMIHIYQRGELLYKDRLSRIACDGKLRPADKAMLDRVRGFGDSTGIGQEMRIRYEKYRIKN